MSPPPLIDPEAPSLPPCRCQCRCQCRCRSRSRCRRLLPVLAAAGAAAALGAAAAAAAVVVLGALRGEPPRQVATAAHLLLSAGSLTLPPGPSWRYEEGVAGVFLSPDLQLSAAGPRLTRGGLYLLYGQLALACGAPPCPGGRLRLRLLASAPRRPLLELLLRLPPGAGPVASGLGQALGELRAGEVLSLEAAWEGGQPAAGGEGEGGEGEGGWQLAQERRQDNFVGLLRVGGG